MTDTGIIHKRKNYRYYVLIVLTLTSALNIADRLILSILLEDIKAEFTMTDTQLGLLAGLAFALFYATLSIPIARWADISNRKNILAGALVVWSGMTALCGAATGFWSLFLARLGVGVGEAGGSPPTYSIIADYFRPSERARAMGVYSTGAVLGTGGGMMLGGVLAEAIGWRMTFVALGIPGILMGILLYFSVIEPPRGQYDEGSEAEKQASDFKQTLRSLASNKTYVRVGISFALLTMVGYAMAVWLAPIMLRNFDVSVSKVGVYLGTAYFIGGIPGPILGGFLTDYAVRFNARWRAWIPAICIIAAVTAFWLCLRSTTLTAFLSWFTLAYFLFMLPQAPTLSLLQTSIKSGQRALGVSIALLINSILGLALGPLIIGSISDSLTPTYGVAGLTYAVLGLCTVAAALASLFYILTAATMPSAPEVDVE